MLSTTSKGYIFGGSQAATYFRGQLPSPDLTWEKTDLEPLVEYMWSAREDTKYYDGAVSFNGFDPDYNKASGNIDHIFYRGAEAQEFITVNGHDYGVYFISDHHPVTCTFIL